MIQYAAPESSQVRVRRPDERAPTLFRKEWWERIQIAWPRRLDLRYLLIFNKMQRPTTKNKWYKARSYAHFDRPRSRSEATKYVTNPHRVAKHRFWPFIAKLRTIHRRKAFSSSPASRKWDKKTRVVCYAAHMDSHIHAYYANLLSSELEKTYQKDQSLNQSVLAYRKLGKSNLDHAASAFDNLEQSAQLNSDIAVLSIDIKSFFDTLNHERLKKCWCELFQVARLPDDHFAVFRSVTRDRAVAFSDVREALKDKHRSRCGKTGAKICEPVDFRRKIRPAVKLRSDLVRTLMYGPGPAIQHLHRGIPQGSAISAVLANLYLLAFDRWAVSEVQKYNGIYRRYSDDILFLVPRNKISSVETDIRGQLHSIGLKLSEPKARRLWFARGQRNQWTLRDLDRSGQDTILTYLGVSFDGRKRYISQKTMARANIKAIRRARKRAKTGPRRHGFIRYLRRAGNKLQDRSIDRQKNLYVARVSRPRRARTIQS